jgi:hypothetical protein
MNVTSDSFICLFPLGQFYSGFELPICAALWTTRMLLFCHHYDEVQPVPLFASFVFLFKDQAFAKHTIANLGKKCHIFHLARCIHWIYKTSNHHRGSTFNPIGFLIYFTSPRLDVAQSVTRTKLKIWDLVVYKIKFEMIGHIKMMYQANYGLWNSSQQKKPRNHVRGMEY